VSVEDVRVDLVDWRTAYKNFSERLGLTYIAL
jgi:hypothetical protein